MDQRRTRLTDPDLLRFLARTTAFLVGLVLISLLLAPLDDHLDVGVVGEKLHYFRNHREEFDTVFVGSSYFYREISPALFDNELERAGSLRSFNFGVPGMDPPESYYLVEEVMAAHPGVRYVYLELDFYKTQGKDANQRTRRFEYWHTPSHTLRTLRALEEEDSNIGWKAKQAAAHLEAMTRKTLHIGQGRAFASGVLGGAGEDVHHRNVLGPADDGWLSLDDDETNRVDIRREYFARHEELAAKVAALRSGHTSVESETEVAIEALRDIVARIRAAGAIPVLVVPPCLDSRAALIALSGNSVDAPVLVFNDPDRYVELYEQGNRFDLGHLNRRGSEMFTRSLAARAAEMGLR